MTCHTDFAIISTDFVHWVCNFTWSTTMHMKLFCILWTNLWKCFNKIHFLLRSKSRQKSQKERESFTSRRQKYFFKAFLEVDPKIQKKIMCIVVLHVKLQPQQTKSVEMRAKSAWQVKIIYFSMYFSYFSIFEIFDKVGCTKKQKQVSLFIYRKFQNVRGSVKFCHLL